MQAGFVSPKTKRSRKELHPSRERRAKFGELLQVDATPFAWFGEDKRYALHGFIDDATSVVTGLYICENECMEGYFEVMRQTLTRYGTPESLYADGLSMFFGKKKQEELSIDEQLSGVYERKTQFGSICDELGISLIHARSSQAKGRIERLWGTLQGRLPAEFAMRGIRDVKEANCFLSEEYINAFNDRFSVNKEAKTSFVALPTNVDLERLLTYKMTRKTDSGSCFSWNNVKFRAVGARANAQITILVSNRLGMKVLDGERLLEVVPLSKGKEKIATTDSVEAIVSRFVFMACQKNEHAA